MESYIEKTISKAFLLLPLQNSIRTAPRKKMSKLLLNFRIVIFPYICKSEVDLTGFAVQVLHSLKLSSALCNFNYLTLRKSL